MHYQSVRPPHGPASETFLSGRGSRICMQEAILPANADIMCAPEIMSWGALSQLNGFSDLMPGDQW